MAVTRDTPYGGGNFLVELGDRDARGRSAGFAEVVFPPFVHGGPRRPDGGAPTRDVDDALAPRLVLRRGVTGDLDLYRWWDERRRDPRAPRRTVTVHLLAEDHESVVLTWRFHEARPVSLSYSPLNAVDGGLVVETIELVFEHVEMR
jgi:phage tail-like protein